MSSRAAANRNPRRPLALKLYDNSGTTHARPVCAATLADHDSLHNLFAQLCAKPERPCVAVGRNALKPRRTACNTCNMECARKHAAANSKQRSRIYRLARRCCTLLVEAYASLPCMRNEDPAECGGDCSYGEAGRTHERIVSTTYATRGAGTALSVAP